MSAVSSVLSVVRGGGRPSPNRAYIIPLDPFSNDAADTAGKRYFQYWPESINSSKQTNWESKVVPGLSHPIYQWIAGGAHEVSFTAVFSRDTQPTTQQALLVSNPTNQETFAKDSDPRNIDIPSAVAWLRQFCYPDYTVGGNGLGATQHPKPPRKMLLGLPGLHLGMANKNAGADEMVCIMTQCEVAYEGFFSNGSPRLAKVNLQFAEIIQRSGRVQVQDAFAFRSISNAGYRLTRSPQDKKQ